MSSELPPTPAPPQPPEPSGGGNELQERPGGLVGLLVSGVEAVLALMGRLFKGIFSAILGNLTGGAKDAGSKDEEPPEGDSRS